MVRGCVRGCAAAVVESVLWSHYGIGTDGGGGGGGDALLLCSIACRGKPQVAVLHCVSTTLRGVSLHDALVTSV